MPLFTKGFLLELPTVLQKIATVADDTKGISAK